MKNGCEEMGGGLEICISFGIYVRIPNFYHVRFWYKRAHLSYQCRISPAIPVAWWHYTSKDSLLPAVRGVALCWWLGASCFNDVGFLTVLLFWVEGGFNWKLAAFLFWLGGGFDWELAEPLVSAELIQSDMLCGSKEWEHHNIVFRWIQLSQSLPF